MPTTEPKTETTPANLYAQRDSEGLGEHYMRHIDRMTREGLHDKSAIAGELAWRDSVIADLLAACKAWLEHFDGLLEDADPRDAVAILTRRFHGERAESTRAAIAKATGAI